MKRDFIEQFINKVSVVAESSSASVELVIQLQDECIALLEKFGLEVPTGYRARRTLIYFKLRIEQALQIHMDKKKSTNFTQRLFAH